MIAVVDYKAGNLTSVKLALKELGYECAVTADRDEILAADRLVFPGVGAAGSAMKTIKEMGLAGILSEFIQTGKPFLGICLGAQIILEDSLENDNTECLAFMRGSTAKFVSTSEMPIKIPQIGWNQVDFTAPHPVFKSIKSGTEFYFVHSYYPVPFLQEEKLAKTVYGDTEFTSVLGKENIIACQFHPEKSGKWGLCLLDNFCRWNPGE